MGIIIMDNEQDLRGHLMRKATALLARREQSECELRQKLHAACAHEGLIGEVIAELQERGYQSDARFAESLVRSRIGRGQGPMRIRQALAQHGIEDEELRQALLLADCDWYALARSVRDKRFGPWLDGDYKQKTKQMRFLAGRGFSQAHIEAAFDAE